MRFSNILAIAATVTVTAILIPQNVSADRLCRQECSGPVCQERCVETEGSGGQREGRRWHGVRPEQRYEDRDERRRSPGIELRVPGGTVGIGR
jgi:hypothetical protein